MHSNLKELLNQLLEGKIEHIEFGDATDPAGFFSGLRIRYMKTAGGKQFRICQLIRCIEASGSYRPDIDSMFIKAIEMATRYTTPRSPKFQVLIAKSNRLPIKCSWFPIMDKEIQSKRQPMMLAGI